MSPIGPRHAAGIPEVWIVDLTTDQVLVCRSPNGDRYASQASIGRSGDLTVEALAGVTVPAASIFA